MAIGDLIEEPGWKAQGVITGAVGERSIAAPESVAGGSIYGEPGSRTVIPPAIHNVVTKAAEGIASGYRPPVTTRTYENTAKSRGWIGTCILSWLMK